MKTLSYSCCQILKIPWPQVWKQLCEKDEVCALLSYKVGDKQPCHPHFILVTYIEQAPLSTF